MSHEGSSTPRVEASPDLELLENAGPQALGEVRALRRDGSEPRLMGALLQFLACVACCVVAGIADERKWPHSHDWCYACGIVFGIVITA